MHIQRLWMAIQRLRTAVRNLQTEISTTSRRLLYSRRENPHKVSSKQATALRCRLQHAATGDAMRCYGQRTALRHLAKNPASDRPACYPTDRDREAPHELCRAGLLGMISRYFRECFYLTITLASAELIGRSGLNPKAREAFGSLLSLNHHLGLRRADWAFGIEPKSLGGFRFTPLT